MSVEVCIELTEPDYKLFDIAKKTAKAVYKSKSQAQKEKTSEAKLFIPFLAELAAAKYFGKQSLDDCIKQQSGLQNRQHIEKRYYEFDFEYGQEKIDVKCTDVFSKIDKPNLISSKNNESVTYVSVSFLCPSNKTLKELIDSIKITRKAKFQINGFCKGCNLKKNFANTKKYGIERKNLTHINELVKKV